MAETIDVLRANKSLTPSKWKENSEWRRANWPWLRHSYKIAITCRSRMRDLGLTQTMLAEKIGCSQQYVSLILQGKENLTLETISKLETALSVELIQPESTIEQSYQPQHYEPQYLSESEAPKYGESSQ